MQEIKLGNIYGATGGNFAGNVYDIKGLSPTINTCGGGNREPLIVEKYEDNSSRDVCIKVKSLN